MGNHISNVSPTTGKVILLDGSIQEFDKPLTVAELMLEFPQQVVVELKSAALAAQTKPTPLPADNKLEPNKIYLMVPLRRGKPVRLSPQEAHHILLRTNAVLRSKTMISSSKFLPFFARICPAVTTTEDPHCKLPMAKEILASEVESCDEVEGVDVMGKPDYLSRQVSGNSWKPSLDTIEEMKNELKRASHLAKLASKVGKRIESKGLVWG